MNIKLRKTRERKKITQTELADMLGISQAQYHRNESGKGFFSEEQWQAISDYLATPLSELRSNEGYNVIFKNNNQSNSYLSYNMYLSDKIINILEDRVRNLENEIIELKKMR